MTSDGSGLVKHKMVNRKMPPLTGIRFFLAIWVVIYHQVGADRAWFDGLHLPQPVNSLLLTGYAAVSVFFVLSGFVLAYNYDLSATWSKRERWRFAIARFSRIYPAYFLGLLCMAPLLAYRITLYPGEAIGESIAGLLNFTLLQSWLPQTALTWNDPGWSLSNESFFYACFPVVGVLLWRVSSPRTFVAWTAGLWALSVLAPLWAIWLPAPGFGDAPATIRMSAASPWTNIVRYNPLIRLPEFCVGILISRIFFWLQSRGTRLEFRGYRLYLPGIAVMLLFLSQAHRIPYPLVHNGLLLPVYACIVLGFAFSGGLLARWLSTKVLVFLGNASYSMYILHVPIAAWLSICSKRIFGLEASGPMWLAVYLTAVVGISSVVYKTVEEPLHYRLKRRLNRLHEEKAARVQAFRQPELPIYRER